MTATIWAITAEGCHVVGPDPKLDRSEVAWWCRAGDAKWHPGETWPGTGKGKKPKNCDPNDGVMFPRAS